MLLYNVSLCQICNVMYNHYITCIAKYSNPLSFKLQFDVFWLRHYSQATLTFIKKNYWYGYTPPLPWSFDDNLYGSS